jgi:hypothetical protein
LERKGTKVNLNLINLPPTEWSKDDWRDAYAGYCKGNMYGPKTKKEYYDFVLERHKRLEEAHKPVSPELLKQWVEGRRAAKAWARKRGCDLNGRLLTDVRAEAEDRSTREIAERAEDMAVESVQRIDDFVETIRRRRAQ